MRAYFSHRIFSTVCLLIGMAGLAHAQNEGYSALDTLVETAEQNVYRNPLEARRLAKEILRLAQAESDQSYQGSAFKIIGGSFFIQGDYDLALEKFLDAYHLYELDHDTVRMAQLLSNIGLVYKNINDYNNSREYYQRALTLVPPADTLSRSRMINNLGVLYQRLEQYDTARYFLEQSLHLKRTLGDQKGMANTLTNLGIISFAEGDPAEAIYHHKKALRLEKALSSDEGTAKCMNNIGSSFLALRQYDSAAYYASNALEISERLKTKEQLKQAYETLAKCAEMKGRFRTAYQFQTQLLETRDSLMNEDVSRRLGQLESRLELASKEAEIERLALGNEISTLRAEKTRNQLIITMVASALIILLLLAIYYQRERKSRAEKLAQESQYDALQKRFVEILSGPKTFELEEDLQTLNDKLHNPLTEREYDALKLSLQGLTNKEIGEKLFVSDHTIKFHLRNIYNKLGVSNRKEALEYVVKSS